MGGECSRHRGIVAGEGGLGVGGSSREGNVAGEGGL